MQASTWGFHKQKILVPLKCPMQDFGSRIVKFEEFFDINGLKYKKVENRRLNRNHAKEAHHYKKATQNGIT